MRVMKGILPCSFENSARKLGPSSATEIVPFSGIQVASLHIEQEFIKAVLNYLSLFIHNSCDIVPVNSDI